MDRELCARIVSSKSVIEREGSHRVRVSSTCSYRRVRTNGAQQVGIVNFRAMSSYQDKISKTLFQQGQYQEAANTGLSLSILEGQYFPEAGTYVIVQVEEKTTGNGVTGLFVTEVSPAPVETPKKRTLDAWYDSMEAEGYTFPSALALEEEVERRKRLKEELNV